MLYTITSFNNLMYSVLSKKNYTNNSYRHTFWRFLSFILCKLLQPNRCFTLQKACDVSDSFISPNKSQDTKTPVFSRKIILQQEHSQDQKRWQFINPLISSVRYDYHTMLCSKRQMTAYCRWPITAFVMQPLSHSDLLHITRHLIPAPKNSQLCELDYCTLCIYGKVETRVTSTRHGILCMIFLPPSYHFPHFWIHMLNATVLPAKPS
jgi:hypothetical protein